MSEFTINIKTLIDNKSNEILVTPTTTAEDVCITLCRQLGISTVARHIFSLRESSKPIYLPSFKTFEYKNSNYDLRIRFKVGDILWLRKIDIKAFDYYFHQAKKDVWDNKIPDLIFEKYHKELLGLGVTDMYRVMLEKDIPQEIVEKDYKKYIPKEVLKRHSFFIRKPIHDALGKIRKSVHDAWYVKEEYLKQLEVMVSEYPIEEYKAYTDQNGSVHTINVRVTPYHSSESGVKYCFESKREKWFLICTIEELGFISIRQDGTVEICRKNGIPFYLKFASLPIMYSFVSLLDGYYRLTVKWTFNICKEVPTPSLQRLYAMKCHGPVGGEFSYAKLEVKRSNQPGCFILRESETKYNILFIDVCLKDSLKPKTYRIERLSEDEFIFNDDLTRYNSLSQLMASYSDPQGAIYLAECLPPSEHDNSPLLLCKKFSLSGDSLTDGSEDASIPSVPVCINTKDLQVYKSKSQKKEGSEGFTVIYKSMWRHTKGKKMEVAMKVLKSEHRDRFLKEFLELSGQWAFVQSNVIVRLFGVTLTSQLSMVLEYVRLGPLDQYLREHKNVIKAVDLVEASSNVASALWHLAENNIVHGNIRCRKLLVSCHDENAFTVKLADPGIHKTYSSAEVHWIPVECYSNLDFARRSVMADVWAFATTLWEIFTCGETIKQTDHETAMRMYASGVRLPRPSNCPHDIYNLMRECWEGDVHRRKQPQAITRDINQILYQVYNSRRKHTYDKIKNVYSHSMESIYSNRTESTNVTNQEDLISVFDMSETDADLSTKSSWSVSTLGNHWSPQESNSSEVGGLSNLLHSFDFSTATSLDGINSIQSIFELDDDCNVVLQGRIGQGFYGEVYKGTLEHIGDNDHPPRLVAVKKLKTATMASCLQDFEREISIMKTLKHPNIVEILGVLQEPEISLVMEFVHHGSLQTYLKIYKETLSNKQLLKYASDIGKGMHYLGTKNIVHRDLAARNILVVDENHVKISDFGLAQVVTNDYYILRTDRELPIKWYALESLRDGKFSIKSDVWSYGVTMCEMFSHGEEPMLSIEKTEGPEQQKFLDALERGTRFPCPSNCPQSVYVRIIYPCWYQDPHQRPTFQKLCMEIEDLLTQY